MKYIICDLDGTLFNLDHRLDMLARCRNEDDYDRFHQRHIDDTVNRKVLNILYSYHNLADMECDSFRTIFITGRHRKFRSSTVKQIEDLGFVLCKRVREFSTPLFVFDLYMKPSYKLYTPDYVKRTVKRIIARYGSDNCCFVLDDRPSTIKVYRDLGLLCLQVKNSTGFLEDVRR